MKEEGSGTPEGSSPLLFAEMLPGGLPVTNSWLFSGTAKYTDLRPLPVPMNLIIMMSRINTQTQNLGQEAANIL